ncbi:MAG TPA: SDR family oxidoreductase [Chitinophagales bacterium]|nr:SDR family oxidoreductase [Chitinophagales bacterium]
MKQKTVLITGAATGIGMVTAQLLDQQGWYVFAGVLPNQSTAELTKGTSEKLTIVTLDLTDDKTILEAVILIEQLTGSDGLGALINNAGVANIGTGVIEGVNMEEVRRLFDINVFGTMRVTQCFLPLLHRYGNARIVNMSSGAVRVPVPGAGAYMMTKAAIEAFTKTLRMELAPFGMYATAIEPGAVRTPMTDNAAENLQKGWEKQSPAIRRRYEAALKPADKSLVEQIKDANSPQTIAAVIIYALTTPNPSPRYVAGKEVKLLPLIQRLLPESTFENILLKQFGLKRK